MHNMGARREQLTKVYNNKDNTNEITKFGQHEMFGF